MPTDLISSISSKELQGNELSRLFASGARAVMVRDDDRINKFVKATLEWLGADESGYASLQFPFGKNLCNLSRSHVAENGLLGDMLRFEPGRIVHTARKFIVYGSAKDQSLQTFPDQFYAGDQGASVPCMIKDLAWTLMSEIFASTYVGTHSLYSSYAVQVEILTYPRSRSEIDVLGNLLANSCGRWSRWGCLIDAYRNNAYGIFDVKIVRDVYALCSLLPGIGSVLGCLNTRMGEARIGVVPKGYFLLGRSHIDDGKYITAIAGCRANVDTQVLGADTWISLDVVPDALAVFPSPKITKSSGILATFHRVLLCDPPDNANRVLQNISLSLSIIDRPKWLD